METQMIILTGLLGLAASFSSKNSRVQFLLFALTGIALLWTSRAGFDKADPAALILGLLSVVIVIGFAAGLALKKYAEWVGLAGTLIALVLLSKTMTYFDFEIIFNPKIALLVALGGLVPILSEFKGRLLAKWFHANAEATATGVSVFLGGLLVFYATFQAQYFGVLLVGTGWLSVALTKQSAVFVSSGIALLSLGFLFMLLKMNPGIDTSFMRGNFLMGLIIGAGALSWTIIAGNFDRFRWLLMFVLPLLIVFAAVLLGKINPNFGGLPAYAGALLGALLLLFTKKSPVSVVPFQAMLIGMSVIAITRFPTVQGPKTTSRIDKTETVKTAQQVTDPMDIPAIQLVPDFRGDWQSIQEGSKLEFKLGPEGGITTGIFEQFDVRLTLGADGEPEKIAVKIPAVSLSTFDPSRDEHLHSADFLNTAKYPAMSYVSKSIKKENDRYFVTGEFTMMGVKQPVNLELKFAANGMEGEKQYLVMVGKSSLDRSKFGMEPDSALGNVVDVTFEIEFRK